MAHVLTTAEKLALLREQLKKQSLDGYLLPRADRFQNEYLPASEERLAWLTGFTGSAGTFLLLPERAVLFVDGRYTVQAAQQVDTALIECVQIGANQSLVAWLSSHLQANQRLGSDAWTLAQADYQRLGKACAVAGASLLLCDNLVDLLWSERPKAETRPVVVQPERYAGESVASKLQNVAKSLQTNGVDAAVISATDSVAWLFNLRGSDVPYNPVVCAFALVDAAGEAELYLDENRLTEADCLQWPETVHLVPAAAFSERLSQLGQSGTAIQLDKQTAAAAIAQQLDEAGAMVVYAQDPCALPKAQKNEIEQQGMRNAHLRDGVALTRFLCWLDTSRPVDATELSVAERLHQFRRDTAKQFAVELKDLSFNTISAAGEHAALPHYSATEASDRQLCAGDIYLVDSGGQYQDGTTDVTRTLVIDALKPEDALIKDRNTRVLKGHIQLAMARFPQGVSGHQLDVLARQFLWQAGLDFDHGTGHGVGSYLCVHEGPQGISPRANAQPLLPGMVVSNEPGYYQQGDYGIRIENLVMVAAPSLPDCDGAQRPMLQFETLTLAPIDRRLIAPELLSKDELAWLNQYHQRVNQALAPYLNESEQAWLRAATAAL